MHSTRVCIQEHGGGGQGFEPDELERLSNGVRAATGPQPQVVRACVRARVRACERTCMYVRAGTSIWCV
jgi:hypothetical protein